MILLEDENKVRSFLLQSFEREGFTTLSFSRVSDLRDHLQQEGEEVDVAILDRMVAGEDGLDLIPLFQKKYPDTRILILSALSDPEERAKALDLGADDYLGKPYSLAELLSRMRVLFRRSKGSASANERSILALGNLEIFLLENRVEVNGQSIVLTPKEYKILSLLAREPGRVWSKFKLLDLVWQINLELESNVVETMIKNLRKKLGESKANVRIESKRGMGYWIEA